MEQKLRISVAMATYNGEKYIEEQLLSICRQTRKPDEIVISDDGSKDATLEIVNRVAKSENAKGINFVIITDNPRHGSCGNFEWAVGHTTGDRVFLSDQDDIWMPEKVERVCAVFDRHEEALLVIHDSDMIDANGSKLKGDFQRYIKFDKLEENEFGEMKISQESFLEPAVSSFLANGMVMCISGSLRDTSLPFPQTTGGHDQWLGFCSLCGDGCWYLSSKLTHYRLHGNNTCGFATHKPSLYQRRKKILNKILHNGASVIEHYYMGKAMLQYLEKYGLIESNAYLTATRTFEIGKKQIAAFQSGGLIGAFKLCNLYISDIRYRRSGTANFAYQLTALLFHSKLMRNKLPQEEE